MLIEGAIRFVESGRRKVGEGDAAGAYDAVVRAQRIVTELLGGLRREHELYGPLSALYIFIHGRLVRGLTRSDVQALDDALRILSHDRETWRQVVEQGRAGVDAPPRSISVTG